MKNEQKETLKLPYEEASMEIIVFPASDVIATSGRPMDDDPNQGEWDSGI